MTIYKRRGQKNYYCTFTFKGRRFNRSTGTSIRREAEKFERKMKKLYKSYFKTDPKKPIEKNKMKLSEAFEKCYEEKWKYNKDTKSPLTRANNIVRMMGDLYINDITNEDITLLINKLEKKHLKI